MAKSNHTLPQELVQEAWHRVGIQEAKDGDAQLIVLGAILEKVSNNRNGNGRFGKVKQLAAPAAGGGGAALVIMELTRALVGG